MWRRRESNPPLGTACEGAPKRSRTVSVGPPEPGPWQALPSVLDPALLHPPGWSQHVRYPSHSVARGAAHAGAGRGVHRLSEVRGPAVSRRSRGAASDQHQAGREHPRAQPTDLHGPHELPPQGSICRQHTRRGACDCHVPRIYAPGPYVSPSTFPNRCPTSCNSERVRAFFDTSMSCRNPCPRFHTGPMPRCARNEAVNAISTSLVIGSGSGSPLRFIRRLLQATTRSVPWSSQWGPCGWCRWPPTR